MMLPRLRKLWRYNEWGWGRVWPHLSLLAEARPQDYFAERPVFWHSLHGLAAHSLGAEEIWLARLQGNSPTHLTGKDDYDSLTPLLADWARLHSRWQAYMHGLTAAEATRDVQYQNTSGRPNALTAVDIIQHVINHATEHRSQLTPQLHQLGFATQPLDYLAFCLEND